MTTVLLIRHGQSQANLTRCFAGHYDAPLTLLGRTQAQRTAAFIAGKYAVDAVYASDLSRALDTGSALARHLDLPICPDSALREIRAGEWEGVAMTRLLEEYPEDYGLWRNDIGSSCPTGGEPVTALAERIRRALTRIASENPGKTVAVATHATPIRCVQWLTSGQSLSYMKEIPWVTNASVTELFVEDGAFRLGAVGQDDHLQDLKTALPRIV